MSAGFQPTSAADRDLVVEVSGVSKKYCRKLKKSLRYGVQDLLGDMLYGRHRQTKLRDGEFWATKDVSFKLRQGEAVGLVGRNGAGKSTLLKIVSGLIRPDEGFVRTRGRIAPLLQLGAGFNPILTGRENIFMNMSLLGLATSEIKNRFDSIVDFAEIEEALDAPLRTYSSGMAARLGFSCAIHVEPDVFIIDEVLAVGDAAFRGKCYRKLADLRRNGVSLILVAHDTGTLTSICDTAIYLRDGRPVTSGPTLDVINKYNHDIDDAKAEYLVQAGVVSSETSQAMPTEIVKPPRGPETSPGLDILEMAVQPDDDGTGVFSGRPFTLRMRCRCYREIRDANVRIGVKRVGSQKDFVQVWNSIDDGDSLHLPPGDHELRLQFPLCGFPRGSYSVKTQIHEPQFYQLDIVEINKLFFTVESDPAMQNCQFYQPRRWDLGKHAPTVVRLAS